MSLTVGDTTDVTVETAGVPDENHSLLNHTTSDKWTLFGKPQKQTKVVYLSQICILYIIIITALVNITIGSKDFNLWSTLLASCIGLNLPSPKLKAGK